MAIIYVAKSQSLAKWGANVGFTKHLYKVGVAESTAEAALKALNKGRYAGEADWRLVTKQQTEFTDESAMLECLGRKERMVDPDLYPKLGVARGIFKVKLANVENHLLVKKTLEGSYEKTVKVKPTDIGDYLILNALK
jgi:hypothetical protein